MQAATHPWIQVLHRNGQMSSSYEQGIQYCTAEVQKYLKGCKTSLQRISLPQHWMDWLTNPLWMSPYKLAGNSFRWCLLAAIHCRSYLLS